MLYYYGLTVTMKTTYLLKIHGSNIGNVLLIILKRKYDSIVSKCAGYNKS